MKLIVAVKTKSKNSKTRAVKDRFFNGESSQQLKSTQNQTSTTGLFP